MHQAQYRVQVRFIDFHISHPKNTEKFGGSIKWPPQKGIYKATSLKMLEVKFHKCKLFIVLKPPNIFGLHHRIRHKGLSTIFIDDVVNSLNLCAINIPRKFYKKIRCKCCCETDRLPILGLTKDTDQVLFVCISGFPSDCLEDYHPSVVWTSTENFNILY